MLDGSFRSSSSISVRQLAKSQAKGGIGQCIRTTLPYIRSDVPILIVFKALGLVVGFHAGSREVRLSVSAGSRAQLSMPSFLFRFRFTFPSILPFPFSFPFPVPFPFPSPPFPSSSPRTLRCFLYITAPGRMAISRGCGQ